MPRLNAFARESATFLDMRASRYAVSLALVAVALCLTLVLQYFESGRPTLIPFFAAIVVAAWLGGVGPGCVAAAAALPAGLYFYAKTLHTVSIAPDNVLLFFFFAACAMAGGLLSTRQRGMRDSLDRAHSELEFKAIALSSTNDALRIEMTERRRAELALADTRAKLAHSARLMALGELTASIAHEINQPLAAVATNANCCLHWLEPAHFDLEEAREAAAGVVQDSTRANEVIRRIRAMACGAPPERGPVDLNAVVREALTLVDAELRHNGVETRLALVQDLPAVSGDAVQLQQVVLNVVLNAMEAMAAVPARTLDLRTAHDDRHVALTASDTGLGFRDREPNSVFDAFVTTKPEGMGLGLSICRTIVEGHGGHMSAREAMPRGAVIEIVLPVEVSQ
ncbi:MAG TPA: ATP-binding protein [Rhizomicrobium sp.]|nr:ATP-binding protein [Rhizomicrobium sp.]